MTNRVGFVFSVGDIVYDIYSMFKLETQSKCHYWACVTLRPQYLREIAMKCFQQSC